MAKVEGYIEHIVFQNKENGYCVFTVVQDGEEYCLTGIFPDMAEGEYIKADGEMVVHPVYGEQLRVSSYEYAAPTNKVAIERYLASGAIKGIGEALAARIIKKFGDDTFRIMEEEPERLAEVKGISERKAMEISTIVVQKKDLRQAMLFLQGYGISQNLALKIYEKYDQEMYRILRENPYRLADDIDGVGFRTADEIAAKAGIEADSDYRIKSGMIYVLQQATAQGHTCLPYEKLVEGVNTLLEVETLRLEELLTDLIIDRKIMVRQQGEQKMVYTDSCFYTELTVAQKLKELNLQDTVSQQEIEKKRAEIERQEGITLDEYQKQAVAAAVNQGLTVITGGPGTGKTTTIKTIIRYFINEGLEVLLAAPTGRAAKRMTEATGYEAKTIHRLLEVNGAAGESHTFFGRDEENPLEADVIIIDEMSMVDIFLMNALLKAMVAGMRLVLVGDVNQLPSVGPGNVLKDIISSERFPVVHLKKVFRQAAGSDIIMNAHRINAGQMVGPKAGSKDFLFVLRDNPGNIVGASITLLKNKLPAYVHADVREIQVLTPMRKGVLGVEQLNTTLQQYLNPPDLSKQETLVGNVTFREGDKVMQIKNNYQKEWKIINSYRLPVEEGLGIFNGDMGVIKEINTVLERITVEFEEGKRVDYGFKEAEELELAYAVTIHKSQGSEYPAVILPLLSGPRMLMNRNLLYTAVTRAKSCVCVVGSLETFQAMIANEQEQKRYSGLKQRIGEAYELGG